MIELTQHPLDPGKAVRAALTAQDGACVLFVGVVRDHSRGQSVTGLEYQAYLPLAQKQMLRVAESVQTRWGLACSILHRFGYIGVGELAVVVCVAGAHRGEAFEACRWAIDTIKAEVPIWKKEYAENGTYWIEGENALPANPPPAPFFHN